MEGARREHPAPSLSAIPLFRLTGRTEAATSTTVMRINNYRTTRGVDGAARQQQGNSGQTTENFHFRTRKIKTQRVYERSQQQGPAFRNTSLASADAHPIMGGTPEQANQSARGAIIDKVSSAYELRGRHYCGALASAPVTGEADKRGPPSR
jgi:hypothetical protein